MIEAEFEAAIRAFWTGRDLQAQKQAGLGVVDTGTRGAVTGGKHMEPLGETVANLFRAHNLEGLQVQHGGKLTLPGHYRRGKDWDLVVQYKGALVAAIEFKSQSGSFGNNFNNRSEEAMGNAMDVWRATQDGVFGSVRPWLGFVMVVEEAPQSTTPLSRESNALYPTDPVFAGTSYIDRYRILFQRLVNERLYDAAAVIASQMGGGITSEPMPELSLRNFAAAIDGRMAYIKGLGL